MIGSFVSETFKTIVMQKIKKLRILTALRAKQEVIDLSARAADLLGSFKPHESVVNMSQSEWEDYFESRSSNVKRLIVTGPSMSGKTTLAEGLAYREPDRAFFSGDAAQAIGWKQVIGNDWNTTRFDAEVRNTDDYRKFNVTVGKAYLRGISCKSVIDIHWWSEYASMIVPNDNYVIFICPTIDEYLANIEARGVDVMTSEGEETAIWVLANAMSYYCNLIDDLTGLFGKYAAAVDRTESGGYRLLSMGAMLDIIRWTFDTTVLDAAIEECESIALDEEENGGGNA
jgi:GTPase SAR1 family protein